jgi:hypothetical protein
MNSHWLRTYLPHRATLRDGTRVIQVVGGKKWSFALLTNLAAKSDEDFQERLRASIDHQQSVLDHRNLLEDVDLSDIDIPTDVNELALRSIEASQSDLPLTDRQVAREAQREAAARHYAEQAAAHRAEHIDIVLDALRSRPMWYLAKSEDLAVCAVDALLAAGVVFARINGDIS